jgi:hypothetical protein
MTIDWINTVIIKLNTNNTLEQLKNVIVNNFKDGVKIINININLNTLKLVIETSKNTIIHFLDEIISKYKEEQIIYTFNCKGDDGSIRKGKVIKKPNGNCIELEEELKKKIFKTVYQSKNNDYINPPTMLEVQSTKFC